MTFNKADASAGELIAPADLADFLHGDRSLAGSLSANKDRHAAESDEICGAPRATGGLTNLSY